MLAAVFGHQDIVALLLSRGADVRLKDALGLTAMDWAQRRGFPNIRQLIATASTTNVPTPRQSPAVERRIADQQSSTAHPINEQPVQQEEQESGDPLEPTADSETTRATLGAAATAMLQARGGQTHSEVEPPIFLDRSAIDSDSANQPVENEAPTVQDLWGVTGSAIPSKVMREEPPDAAIEETPQASPEATPVETVEDNQISASVISHVVLDAVTSSPTSVTISEGSQSTTPGWVGSNAEIKPPVTLEPAEFNSVTREAVTDESTLPSLSAAVSKETSTLPSRSIDDEVTRRHRSPSFDSLQSHGPSRPMLWLLVVVVFGLTAFATYSLIKYFSSEEAPAPAVTVKNEESVESPVKTNVPVVGGELAGAAIDVPEPEYPARAAAMNNGEGITGTVTVRVRVNRRGRIISIRMMDGDPALQAAALTAARKSTFAPEKLPDNGGTVTGTISYNFTPPKKEAQESSQISSPSPPETSVANVPDSEHAGTDSPQSGGPLAGTETNLPEAEYPASVRNSGVSGQVTVTVRVNRAGRVISWRTGEGNSRLRAAALKAAKRATFSPEKLPGNGEVVGTITYTFKP